MNHTSGCPARHFPDLPCKCGGEHVTMELRKENGKGPYTGSLPQKAKLPTPEEFDQNYSIGYSGEFYRACHERMEAAERVLQYAVDNSHFLIDPNCKCAACRIGRAAHKAIAEWEKTK